MDRQACLKELLEAVADGEIEDARERLFDLVTWIDKGGFCPVLTPATAHITLPNNDAKLVQDLRQGADNMRLIDGDHINMSRLTCEQVQRLMLIAADRLAAVCSREMFVETET